MGATSFHSGSAVCPALVTKPEYIKQGLQNEDWPPISRGRIMHLSDWYSGGLFVNFGEEHHRQRVEIWKPMLSDPAIPRLAAEMSEEWTGSWQAGKTYDVFRELRALCFAIDWKALTGEDLRQQPATLQALEVGCDTLTWLILPFGPKRWNMPLPSTLKAKSAKAHLNERITAMVAERRKNPSIDDLLAKMIKARDAKGSKTTDAQINSNVMMVFGADQLHALFVWTFYLLSQNPAAESKMLAELDRELSGPPTPEDNPKLKYTRNVLMESMRVMPPVWGFFRALLQDYQMGDTLLPAGSVMGFSPWVTQRDERYWPDPLRFDPDRWLPGAKRPPELAYFPFSSGPYRCHGTELAMIEAFLIMTTIVRRWTFKPASSQPPKPTATWCTEPKGGLHMRLEARKK